MYLKVFKFKKIILPIFLVLCSIFQSSCTDFRQAIGKEKFIPDEFAIMRSPSLVVPPGYGIDLNAFEKSETDLETETIISLENENNNSNNLQSLFNFEDIPKNIRKLIDDETRGISLSNRKGIDILLGNTPKTGIVINSEKEMLRLKKNNNNSTNILSNPSPSINITNNKKINID